MEILVVCNMKSSLLEPHFSHAEMSHFIRQKFLKHVTIIAGVPFSCFMLFGLKDARCDDGERRCTQSHPYLEETKRRLKHFRRIFLTAITKLLTVYMCRDEKLSFIRHLHLYGKWTSVV